MNKELSTTVALSSLLAINVAAAAQTSVLVGSDSVQSRNNQIQLFSKTVTLPPERASNPLTLTVENGKSGKAAFQWLRCFVTQGESDSQRATDQPTGLLVLNETMLKGTNRAVIDLTNKLSSGQNQITIQGAGLAGATCSWTITQVNQPTVSVTALDRSSVIAGQTVHVTGSGLADGQKVSASLENTRTKRSRDLPVANVTANGFDVTIPADVHSADYRINATVNGRVYAIASNLTVRRIVLRSSDLASVVPGGTIVITGTGFSETAEQNVVTFTSYNGRCLPSPPGLNAPYYDGQTGSYQGQVVSATPTQLTVIAPQDMMQYISVLKPVPCHITATVQGVAAQGEVNVLVGSLNFGRGTQTF